MTKNASGPWHTDVEQTVSICDPCFPACFPLHWHKSALVNSLSAGHIVQQSKSVHKKIIGKRDGKPLEHIAVLVLWIRIHQNWNGTSVQRSGNESQQSTIFVQHHPSCLYPSGLWFHIWNYKLFLSKTLNGIMLWFVKLVLCDVVICRLCQCMWMGEWGANCKVI